MPILIYPVGGHILSSCGVGSLIKVYNIPATYAVNRRKRRDRKSREWKRRGRGERERKGEKERRRNGSFGKKRKKTKIMFTIHPLGYFSFSK
jgi:hypothetical protein